MKTFNADFSDHLKKLAEQSGESIGVKQMDEITINPAMATSVIILDTATGQSDYLDLTQDNLPKIIEYFTRIEELANS
jgi:hypothetical protein